MTQYSRWPIFCKPNADGKNVHTIKQLATTRSLKSYDMLLDSSSKEVHIVRQSEKLVADYALMSP